MCSLVVPRLKTHRCPPRRGETRDLAMSSSSSDGSNAAESDDDEFFATVLDELPPVRGAFAYGSAVFGQRDDGLTRRSRWLT